MKKMMMALILGLASLGAQAAESVTCTMEFVTDTSSHKINVMAVNSVQLLDGVKMRIYQNNHREPIFLTYSNKVLAVAIYDSFSKLMDKCLTKEVK